VEGVAKAAIKTRQRLGLARAAKPHREGANMAPHAAMSQLQRESLLFLEETFETHHGIYIDKGTTLFDTLAGITAAKASLRASDRTASIVAHVRHVVFYLQVLQKSIRGEEVGRVNWREIWETDRPVTPDEWGAVVQAMKTEWANIRRLHAEPATWEREDAHGEFMAIAIHTAYHLGAVRQAIAVIESGGGEDRR
jgi:hypothetical protein